jgi:uncharacterized repeat protein (TIGR02543 family)
VSGIFNETDFAYIKSEMGATLNTLDMSGLTNTLIPDNAFNTGEDYDQVGYMPTALNTVILSDRITVIGDYAFRGQYSINNEWDLSHVESIGEGAFYDCSGLRSITSGGATQLNLSLTTIPAYAFYGCRALQGSLDLSHVTSIGEYAFYDCSSLQSITSGGATQLNPSLSIIPAYAFYQCMGLQDGLDLSHVMSIGEYAFYDCGSLQSITSGGATQLNSNLTTIPEYAFYHCSGLGDSLDLSHITNLGEGAFSDCYNLVSITSGGTTQLNPDLKEISQYAFSMCEDLADSLDLSHVTSIGEGAFQYCMKLESITSGGATQLNPDLTTIENRVFSGCESLTDSLDLSHVTSIGEYAFYYCSSLQSITSGGATQLNPNLMTIQNSAFQDCESLTDSLDLSHVTSIGEYAFYGCRLLEDITFPDHADYGFGAFNGCALDLRNGYPVNTNWLYVDYSDYYDETDFFGNQNPIVHFTLNPTKAAIDIGGDLPAPAVPTTLNGDYNSMFTAGTYPGANDNERPEWLSDESYVGEVGVTVSAVKKGTNESVALTDLNTKTGVYTLTYELTGLKDSMIAPTKRLENFELTVNLPIITGDGFVYKDIDGNNSYTAADSLYANIDVGLYEYKNGAWNAAPIKKSKTNAQGVYGFTGVDAGTYRVAPIVAVPYETTPSQTFKVVPGENTSVSYSLPVRAKASLLVSFLNQNNAKVGADIELYGARSEYLYDLSRPVNVSALPTSSVVNRTEVAIPESAYYGLVGANTQSATFDFDKPTTWNKTITFRLEGKRFTVTYDGNGATKAANPNSDIVVYPDTHIKALPAAPERDGYTFKGWQIADGKAFTTDTEIVADVTVTAQWEKIVSAQEPPTPPVTEPNTPPAAEPQTPPAQTTEAAVTTATAASLSSDNETTVTRNQDPVDLSEEPASNEPRVVDQRKLAEISAEQGIPTLGIGDSGIPLFGPAGYGCWALVDLLLAVAGLILLMLAISRAVLRRRSDAGLRVRIGFVIGEIALAAISTAVFLITQDMSMPMVMLDAWSILLTIALAAEIACIRLALPKGKTMVDVI